MKKIKNVLVAGGAGYIGSVVVDQLTKGKYNVTVFDNFSTGHREALRGFNIDIVKGDILNKNLLIEVMANQSIDAVMHFAASIEAGESMKTPEKFFENNTAGSLSLLEAMNYIGVKHIVFSSTAAVYGMPRKTPITEDMELKPVNVYGESKLMVEKMLFWFNEIYGLNYAALRYFNACGATESLGENHQPETHLIPLAIDAVTGKRKSLRLFGTDYDTKDGTCIRDYIHVLDLARAHILALEKLGKDGGKLIYNLGSQKGFSNREVIRAVEKVTMKKVPVIETDRRPGDPAVLIASSEKIKKELGWKAQLTDIEEVVESACNWHKKHPGGYST